MSVIDIGVTVSGFVAILFLAWFFFGPKKAKEAEVDGGVQEVRITVKGGYSPDVIRVKEDVPLWLVFDSREANRSRRPRQYRSNSEGICSAWTRKCRYGSPTRHLCHRLLSLR